MPRAQPIKDRVWTMCYPLWEYLCTLMEGHQRTIVRRWAGRASGCHGWGAQPAVGWCVPLQKLSSSCQPMRS